MFGEDRVLYGSDWPGNDQWADYPKVLGVVREILQGRAGPWRRKIFLEKLHAAYRWVKRDRPAALARLRI